VGTDTFATLTDFNITIFSVYTLYHCYYLKLLLHTSLNNAYAFYIFSVKLATLQLKLHTTIYTALIQILICANEEFTISKLTLVVIDYLVAQ